MAHDIPAWMRQDMKKVGPASAPCTLGPKVMTGPNSLHSKIAKPTHHMGGMVHDKTAARPVKMANGGMVRGYADGGEVVSLNPYQGDDVDPFSAVRNSDGGTAPSESVDTGMMEKEPVASVEAKSEPVAERPMKFGDAFAAARRAGQKSFEWNGKKYTTELASASKAAPSRTAPARASSGSLAQSKGAEYATLEKIARDAETNSSVSASARSAARANADRARKVYEDAAAAEKEGRSVVLRR